MQSMQVVGSYMTRSNCYSPAVMVKGVCFTMRWCRYMDITYVLNCVHVMAVGNVCLERRRGIFSLRIGTCSGL